MAFTWVSGHNQIVELELPNYLVTRYEGFANTPVELQTQKSPYQHGTTLIDTILSERNCNMNLIIIGRSKQEKMEKRRQLIKAFSPRIGMGKLKWYQEGLEKEFILEAMPDEAPMIPSGSEGVLHQEAVINLMAPDPTWYSGINTIEYNTAETGRVNVYNDGDVETSVQIIIEGACENPEVINMTTGEKIELNGVTLLEGEKISINTKYGVKTATHYDSDQRRSNMLGKLGVSSVMFYLQAGSNQIEVRTTSGNPMVELKFKSRYGGV